MRVIEELLANNRSLASGVEAAHLDVKPSLRLAVLTCMDSRLDVFQALGLRDGEAHILRNAGGVITDDVIRSLAISQRLLGTVRIMLIHHTDCGMQTLTDDGFRADLQRRQASRRLSRSSRSPTPRRTCASRYSGCDAPTSCSIATGSAVSSTTCTPGC